MKAILTYTQTVGEAEHAGGFGLLDCASIDAVHINRDVFEDGWNSEYVDDGANVPQPCLSLETQWGSTGPILSKA